MTARLLTGPPRFAQTSHHSRGREAAHSCPGPRDDRVEIPRSGEMVDLPQRANGTAAWC